jgi:hypothetical protein
MPESALPDRTHCAGLVPEIIPHEPAIPASAAIPWPNGHPPRPSLNLRGNAGEDECHVQTPPLMANAGEKCCRQVFSAKLFIPHPMPANPDSSAESDEAGLTS